MRSMVKCSGWRKAEEREVRELTFEDYVRSWPGPEVHPVLVRATGPRHTGELLEVRFSGQPKTWKTRPGQVKRPVKYGLYESFYVGTAPGCETAYTLVRP